MLRTALSGVLVAAAYVTEQAAHLGAAGAPAAVALYLLAVLTGGWRTARLGLANLLRLRFDMNTLMTVAVAGAIAIGEWQEAGVVAFLFGVSETLEAYSIEQARRSLRSLLELAPPTARVLRGGDELVLPVEQVQVGDRLRVRPGEKIPLDGVIVAGTSSIREAAITGEALPVDKGAGDSVYAGTLNGEGVLEIEATRRAHDTTLARVIELVERAQEERAPAQAFIDRFARRYTPAVLAAALLIATVPPLVLGGPWAAWIYRGLALLIVACPCALVVSTPVAIVTAIGNAARHGVLIKGGVHLENLGAIRALAVDKTGTLTQGEPRVTDIDLVPPRKAEEALASPEARDPRRTSALLGVLAGIEARSEHPLARAVASALAARGIEPSTVAEVRALPGRGISAKHGGRTYYVGNVRLFRELGVDLTAAEGVIARRQAEGKTTVLFGHDRELHAVIALADTPRPGVTRTLRDLERAGIGHIALLTGDNVAAARAVATDAGIADYRAELLPEDKVAAVRALRERYGSVAMVGDGVNDAPALAAATIGIAMGGAGSDTALETADVVLMADDLSKLPFAIDLGRRALAVIRQNVAFALLAKALALLLVFPGWLTLWLAILSDMGATLLVVANSLRLLRVRPGGRS